MLSARLRPRCISQPSQPASQHLQIMPLLTAAATLNRWHVCITEWDGMGQTNHHSLSCPVLSCAFLPSPRQYHRPSDTLLLGLGNRLRLQQGLGTRDWALWAILDPTDGLASLDFPLQMKHRRHRSNATLGGWFAGRRRSKHLLRDSGGSSPGRLMRQSERGLSGRAKMPDTVRLVVDCRVGSLTYVPSSSYICTLSHIRFLDRFGFPRAKMALASRSLIRDSYSPSSSARSAPGFSLPKGRSRGGACVRPSPAAPGRVRRRAELDRPFSAALFLAAFRSRFYAEFWTAPPRFRHPPSRAPDRGGFSCWRL